jgi:uncharacterized protein (DUF1330 family)
MKSSKAIVSAIVAGLAGWALAGAALAQEAAPGYLLVTGKSVDRARIGAYAASLPPVYAAHRGRYLAIGAPGRGVRWIEGPWTDRSLILARFPDRAAVDAFWWGPEYRAVIGKRDRAGVFSVAAMTGLGPTPFEGPEAAFLVVMSARRDGRPATLAQAARAFSVLREGVLRTGGRMMTSGEAGAHESLEGDAPFDRIALAAWPTKAGRDAFLASGEARLSARLRAKAGLGAVATADGAPAAPAPPAATR